MSEENQHRVADYFVVVGSKNFKKPDGDGETLEPITDIAVIFKNSGEHPPEGYECIEFTPTGLPADLNYGSLRSPTCFLCYRRGRDKPPLTDIGVLYEGKQRLMPGCGIIHKTASRQVANVNNAANMRIFITYRRASPQFAHSSLAVIEICVIVASKGEKPPHAFCLIDKNLNQGLVGSDVYLCYRKSLARTNSLSYAAEILSRYPHEDYQNFTLPDSVSLFCLPLGAVVECWPEKAQPPLPIFSTFALTGAKGEKVFGAGITFFEELPSDLFSEEVKDLLKQQQENNGGEKSVAHTNKCICLLSHYPFFDAFRKFLMSLYRLSVSGGQPVPLERYISHFMLNVPFPTPQRPRVLVQMTHESFEIAEPSHGPLPVSGASYTALLRCLGPENVMVLLHCALTEQKILIHSLRPALLTSVSEALVSIIFPFSWQCPYIPLCPLALADVLSAPVPFIYGIDSRFFDRSNPPEDVTCVDLDTNMITQAIDPKDPKAVTWKSLPKKAGKILKDRLDELFFQLYQIAGEDNTDRAVDIAPLEADSSVSRKKQSLEINIQEAFLRFHAQALKGYRQYLLPITSRPTVGSCDINKLFDLQGFLKSRPRENQKFFSQLSKTQLFSRLLEQRSFTTISDHLFAFFDDCIEKCESAKPLLQCNISISQSTVVVTPPDPTGLPPNKLYSYSNFPALEKDLFVRGDIANSPKVQTLNTPPRSPLVVDRTKHEREQSSMSARKQVNSPTLWARCLLGHCYAIWFIHLPAYVKSQSNKGKALHTAFEVLQRVEESRAQLPDEVCFRVLMQLSGQFGHPALAVKVLFEMKRQGIVPNAVTWGCYHQAVIKGQWNTEQRSAKELWKKIKNFISAVNGFRKGLKKPDLISFNAGSSEDINTGKSNSSKIIITANSSENIITGNSSENITTGSSSSENITTGSTSSENITTGSSSSENISSLSINVDKMNHQTECESEGTASDAGYSSLLSTEDLTRTQPFSGGLSEFSSEFPDVTKSTKEGFRAHRRNPSEASEVDSEAGSTDSNFLLGGSTDFPWFRRHKMVRRLSETSIGSNLSESPGSNQIIVCQSSSWHDEPYELTTNSLDEAEARFPLRYKSDISLEAVIGTSQACKACSRILYDEEIMGGWGAEDSNWTTICPFCNDKQVPSLFIKIKDYRGLQSKICSSSSLSSEASFSHSVSSAIDIGHEDLSVSTPALNIEPSESELMSPPTAPLLPFSPTATKPMPINKKRFNSARDLFSSSAPTSGSSSPIPGHRNSPRPQFYRVRKTSSSSSVSMFLGSPEEKPVITLPYLSPLVLRKELENLLKYEGDLVLQGTDIVQQKPILFWNMIWYFRRLGITSHLPSLIIRSLGSSDKSTEQLQELSRHTNRVIVSTSWDSDRQEEGGTVPLYMLWNVPTDQQEALLDKGWTSRNVLTSVSAHIQDNDVASPLSILMDERTRQQSVNTKVHWSLYRELLFLSLTACGIENIDIEAFDREYKNTHKQLVKDHADQLLPDDKPPTAKAFWCRRAFQPPTLQPRVPSLAL